MAQSSSWAQDFGDTSPEVDTYPKTWDAGSWRTNTDVTSVETGLIGWFCVISGHPGTWIAIYASPGSTGGLPRVANIADLAAINCTSYSSTQAHIAEVLTVGDFFKHSPTGALGTWSNATAYAVGNVVWDGSHSYVAIQAGTNHAPSSSPTFWTLSVHQVAEAGVGRTSLWTRLCIPNASWQKLAVNGTGFFINPSTGDDEAVGTASGTPIKTVREFCTRMNGAVFDSTSPRLTVLATSTNADDANFFGFTTRSTTPLLLIGTETVLGTATLSAAADLNAASAMGFCRSTGTDFLSLGYESNSTRTVFAKRANSVGNGDTYAAVQKAYNTAGPVYNIDVSPQSSMDRVTYAFTNVTTQVFAAADVISLVTRPAWPGFHVPSTIAFTPINLDLAAGANIDVTSRFRPQLLGLRNGATAANITSGNTFFGGIIQGTFNSQRFCPISWGHFGLGSRLQAGNVSSASLFLCSGRATFVNAAVAQEQGTFEMSCDWWVQDSGSVFEVFQGLTQGKIEFRSAGFTYGIGPNVSAFLALIEGSQFFGATRITRVNAFTAGSPWTIGGTGYTDAEILDHGVLDAVSMCSVVA